MKVRESIARTPEEWVAIYDALAYYTGSVMDEGYELTSDDDYLAFGLMNEITERFSNAKDREG